MSCHAPWPRPVDFQVRRCCCRVRRSRCSRRCTASTHGGRVELVGALARERECTTGTELGLGHGRHFAVGSGYGSDIGNWLVDERRQSGAVVVGVVEDNRGEVPGVGLGRVVGGGGGAGGIGFARDAHGVAGGRRGDHREKQVGQLQQGRWVAGAVDRAEQGASVRAAGPADVASVVRRSAASPTDVQIGCRSGYPVAVAHLA